MIGYNLVLLVCFRAIKADHEAADSASSDAQEVGRGGPPDGLDSAESQQPPVAPPLRAGAGEPAAAAG